MGGTAERGRGALQGRVLYTPKGSVDRVSHISIKVKCVVLARTPVANAHAPHPAPIVDRSPGTEKVHEREVTLLQLGDTIYAARENKDTPAEARGSNFHPPTAVADLSHGELANDGKTAAFSFKIELPRNSLKEAESLPPSFVLTSGEESFGPSVADTKLAQDGNLIGRGLSLLSINQGAPPPAPDRHHWASVKWYVKATIGRPGVLQTNDRILIPFQYLTPPPTDMSVLMDVRARIGAELHSNTPYTELSEPLHTWRTFPVGPEKPDPSHRKRGFFNLFPSSQKMLPPDWSVSMPQAPSSFTVQGSVPFTLISTVRPNTNGEAPLSLALYRRLYISRRKDSQPQAIDERLMCEARIASIPATTTTPEGGTVYSWNGVLDLPPSVGPSFRTKMLDLEYYIGMVEVNPQERPLKKPKRKKVQPLPPPEQFIHTMPVQIHCPPPRPMSGAQTGLGVMHSNVPSSTTADAETSLNSAPRLPDKPWFSHTAGAGQDSAQPPLSDGSWANAGPDALTAGPQSLRKKDVRIPIVPATGTTKDSHSNALSPDLPTVRPSAATGLLVAGSATAREVDVPLEGPGFGLGLPPSYFEAVDPRDHDGDRSRSS